MLDDSQLSHFRSRQALTLMDVCHKLTYSRTSNDYNEAEETWTEDNTDIACGIQDNPGNEQRRDKDVLTTYDAAVRFALGIALDIKDRIKVTKRFGESITPITYEVASPSQSGPSGVRYMLKRVDL